MKEEIDFLNNNYKQIYVRNEWESKILYSELFFGNEFDERYFADLSSKMNMKYNLNSWEQVYNFKRNSSHFDKMIFLVLYDFGSKNIFFSFDHFNQNKKPNFYRLVNKDT